MVIVDPVISSEKMDLQLKLMGKYRLTCEYANKLTKDPAST